MDSYINVQHQNFKAFSNISNQERKALSELKARSGCDIVILPAKKSGGTYVVSREDYVKEGNRQLSEPLTYKILNHDITNKVEKSVEELLVGMKKNNVIDLNLYLSLLPTSSVPSRLYFLMKVYKQGNLGRPIIISGNGTAMEKLLAFVGFHLTRYMSCNYIPSYIKDTTDFLNSIRQIPKLPDIMYSYKAQLWILKWLQSMPIFFCTYLKNNCLQMLFSN